MNNSIEQKIFDEIFRKHRKILSVYLIASKSKSDVYDTFRDTGYKIVKQNPLPVKAITKVASPGTLRYHEIGLVKSGALQIIIQNRDANLIKNCEKLSVDNTTYYPYHDAVGNKFQIFPTQFAKYSKIIVFRKDI